MDIINLQSKRNDVEPRYIDKNIALCDDLRHLSRMKETVQIGCFVILLVKSGHANISIGDHTLEMRERDLFSCLPRTIAECAMLSTDFDARVFVISPEFAGEIVKQSQINFNMPMLEKANNVLHLSEEEAELITNFYDTLNLLYKLPHTAYNNQSINSVLQAIAYKIVDIFEQQGNSHIKKQLNSAESIFSDFLLMLHDPNSTILSVSEYADKLNVSPKYFSSICKSICGKSAKKIIDDEIILNAKNMLRNNRLSIKQIASQLGFANQSHFGSFFRRMTGVSPQQFRQQENI